MADIKHYRIPASHHAVARKLWDDMLALSAESQAVNIEYLQEVAALQAKYGPRGAEIGERMTAVRLEGTKLMCAAVGIDYNPINSHAFETSYLDSCGCAFFSVRTPDAAPANEAEGKLLAMDTEGKKAN